MENNTINELLGFLVVTEENKIKWLNGYNHAFNMTPQQMIKNGRVDEVISYLHYYVYGPY